MANKFDGDVRPLSNDPRYMGVVFEGPIDDAIQQAHDAPDYGVSEQYIPVGISRDRAALLEHLNLMDKPRPNLAKSEPEEPGFYTVEYAIKHWPENFKL